MTSNNDVAEAFSEGKQRKSKHMYCDEKTIFSYGTHFPVCLRVKPNVFLFNRDRYSHTTSQHQSYVESSLPLDSEIINCNTTEIIKAVENPELPIIITREELPKDLDRAIEILRLTAKSKGMKRFPAKKIRNLIIQNIVESNI